MSEHLQIRTDGAGSRGLSSLSWNSFCASLFPFNSLHQADRVTTRFQAPCQWRCSVETVTQLWGQRPHVPPSWAGQASSGRRPSAHRTSVMPAVPPGAGNKTRPYVLLSSTMFSFTLTSAPRLPAVMGTPFLFSFQSQYCFSHNLGTLRNNCLWQGGESLTELISITYRWQKSGHIGLLLWI